MKKSIDYWQMGGMIFTSVLGTFLHFLFDLSGESMAAALFSAVNESIWEHLKLLFYPMVVFALPEYFFWGKEWEGFWCVKLVGVLVGLILIPVLYYTYSGALGVSADWFNVTIFFLAAGLVFWLETKLFQKGFSCPLRPKTVILLVGLIAIAFTVFTFKPPRVPFFLDPVTGTYGFQR